METIQLTLGKVALVDKEDFERVNQYKWCAHNHGHTFYALRRVGKKISYLHQFIMDNPSGEDIDHINHDGLDNRRANLRVVSRSINLAHSRPRGRLGLKGVYKSRKRYTAAVVRDGVRYFSPTLKTAKEAGLLSDAMRRCLFPEGVYMNFPYADPPEYRDMAKAIIEKFQS